MAARKIGIALALAAGCALAAAQSSPSSASSADPAQAGESSSQKAHHKTAHHVTVEEEGATAPELSQAEDFIQKHNYAAAEPLLQKAVSADGASYVAWFDLGFVENGLGKLEESIAAYRKSVAAKPDVFESNLNLGLQLAKTHQPDAEQFLRAATQLKPTSHVAEGQARAWLSLAHVIEATRPEEAIAAYQRAAALQPKDPEPHLSAGLLLEKANKFSDAEHEYKQTLALEPSTDALTGLANIYMRGNRFPEAEQYLRKLVAASPANAPAHIQLGEVLKAEQKYDDAIVELQMGIKLAPQDSKARRDLADLLAAAGKSDQAEAAYRELLAADPNDPELHHNLGTSLLRQKKFPQAQEELLAAVKLKTDYGEAYSDLAFAASENKNYPLTIKALEFRAKWLPESPQTYFLRASACDHLKDFKTAAVNYHLFLNTANGKYPDQEWQAKHRLIAIEPKK